MENVLLPILMTAAIWTLLIATGFLALWGVIRGAVRSALRAHASEQHSAAHSFTWQQTSH